MLEADGVERALRNKISSGWNKLKQGTRDHLYGNSLGGGRKSGTSSTKRPSWRQSELDAAKDFPEYLEQKSFLKGEAAGKEIGTKIGNFLKSDGVQKAGEYGEKAGVIADAVDGMIRSGNDWAP